MKKKLEAILKNPVVRPIEVWAVRALLAYLMARQAAPHRVP